MLWNYIHTYTNIFQQQKPVLSYMWDMMGHCSKKWGRTDMCGIYSFLFVDGPRCGSGSGFHVLLDDAWYPCSLCVLCQDRFDCGSPCPLDPSSQEVRNHSPLAFPGWMGLLLDSIGLKLQCHDNSITSWGELVINWLDCFLIGYSLCTLRKIYILDWYNYP